MIEKPGAATPAPATSATTFARASSTLLQRRCACGGDNSGGCDACERKKLSRRAAGSDSSQDIPPVVGEVLNAPGNKLDAETRAFMEPRFGHDFSRVRVHADERAAESARSVNALAYTVGRDVVFGAGQYRPGTAEGRKLLAHELTHVVQQSSGGEHMALQDAGTSTASGPEEEEARTTGEAIEGKSSMAPAPREGREQEQVEELKEEAPPRTAPGTTGYSTTAKKRYVVYQNEVRVGGSRAWRNNNPGNLRYYDFAKNHGAIGGDKENFAVFPDRATGRAALVALLKGDSYKNLTITAAITKYAPPSENETQKYIDAVVKQTGLPATTKLVDMTDEQLESIVGVIEVKEGWKEESTHTCADAGAPAEFRVMLGCPAAAKPPATNPPAGQ